MSSSSQPSSSNAGPDDAITITREQNSTVAKSANGIAIRILDDDVDAAIAEIGIHDDDPSKTNQLLNRIAFKGKIVGSIICFGDRQAIIKTTWAAAKAAVAHRRRSSKPTNKRSALSESSANAKKQKANDNNNDKKKTATTTTTTTTTPYNEYMEIQYEWMNQRPDILGLQVVKGLSEDIDDSKYTTEQMNSIRVVMITQNRSDQLDKMNHLILKDQAGKSSCFVFNTSFSHDVLDSWQVVKKQLARKTPAQKLDILLAYTSVLNLRDYWMNDNEGGMDVLVKGLAAAWKKLLKQNDDQALGWDLEYTKPGVMALLEQFKSEVEGYDSDYGLGKFKYV